MKNLGTKIIIISATDTQLRNIKKTLQSVVERELATNVLELSLPFVRKRKEKLLSDRSSMRELAGNKKYKKIVKDFCNSEIFYKKTREKKSYKIIVDEFSNEKNSYLYDGFNYIENSLRKLVVMKFGADKILDPSFRETKTSDHKISQFLLSELFEKALFLKASEGFIWKEWEKSEKTKDDFLRISNLLRLDEYKFPLNKEEIVQIKKLRNVCMHFRVITLEEYSETISLINKYVKGIFINDVLDSFNPTIDILSESMKEILKPIANLQVNIEKLFNSFSLNSLSKDISKDCLESSQRISNTLRK